MSAIGFGAKVTGAGNGLQNVFEVTQGGSGAGSLADAFTRAQTSQEETLTDIFIPARIVIKKDIQVLRQDAPLTIRVQNLTIEGESGATISNLLFFDCTASDNVIIRNLTFVGTPGDSQLPHDAIKIFAQDGRGPTGFWIDHCTFQAFKDLNITSNTKDLKKAPPLLITISNCRFHNADPNGIAHRDNGAIGIHGYRKGNTRDLKTNAYATVCNNVFETVRRRSPRSSNLTYVHAFNNVLLRWGATNTTDQVNGMESGNYGVLVAEANYFEAGPLATAITVAGTPDPGTLTVHETDNVLKNMYVNATTAQPAGQQININQTYVARGITPPTVKAIGTTLRDAIQAAAGVPLASTGT